MTKKIDIVRDYVAKGDYKNAMKLVKGFTKTIGADDRSQVTRAYECYINPEFYKQLGKDIDKEIAAGIEILIRIYGQAAA